MFGENTGAFHESCRGGGDDRIADRNGGTDGAGARAGRRRIVNLLSDQPSKTPDQNEAEQAKEKAYKESLRKIPDAKASNDPWGGVRSDAPKAAPAKTPPSEDQDRQPRPRRGQDRQQLS